LKEELIIGHELVPKHEIMKKAEVEQLLKKYGLSIEQLPKILEDDPVVKAIGAKKGQVLRIIRKSPTAGESIYFRVVI